eukprot:354588-Chlamydomonas_euryale.AAC.3
MQAQTAGRSHWLLVCGCWHFIKLSACLRVSVGKDLDCNVPKIGKRGAWTFCCSLFPGAGNALVTYIHIPIQRDAHSSWHGLCCGGAHDIRSASKPCSQTSVGYLHLLGPAS